MSAAADGFGDLYQNVVRRIDEIKGHLGSLDHAAMGLMNIDSDEVHSHRDSIVGFVDSQNHRVDDFLDMASSYIQDAIGEFEILERLF